MSFLIPSLGGHWSFFIAVQWIYSYRLPKFPIPKILNVWSILPTFIYHKNKPTADEYGKHTKHWVSGIERKQPRHRRQKCLRGQALSDPNLKPKFRLLCIKPQERSFPGTWNINELKWLFQLECFQIVTWKIGRFTKHALNSCLDLYVKIHQNWTLRPNCGGKSFPPLGFFLAPIFFEKKDGNRAMCLCHSIGKGSEKQNSSIWLLSLPLVELWIYNDISKCRIFGRFPCDHLWISISSQRVPDGSKYTRWLHPNAWQLSITAYVWSHMISSGAWSGTVKFDGGELLGSAMMKENVSKLMFTF